MDFQSIFTLVHSTTAAWSLTPITQIIGLTYRKQALPLTHWYTTISMSRIYHATLTGAQHKEVSGENPLLTVTPFVQSEAPADVQISRFNTFMMQFDHTLFCSHSKNSPQPCQFLKCERLYWQNNSKDFTRSYGRGDRVCQIVAWLIISVILKVCCRHSKKFYKNSPQVQNRQYT